MVYTRGDADALAYIAAVEGTGTSVSATQKTAINDFYVSAKADSYYTSLKRLYLPIWANAAANAIDMIGLTSGTFVGGVTHGTGYVMGNGTTGYFDLLDTPAELGLSASDAYQGFLCKTQATLNPSVILGVRASASSVMNFSVSGTDLRAVFGSNAILTGTSTEVGIITSTRNPTTRSLWKRLTSGRSVVATDSTAAAGSLPNLDLNYMRFNRSDGAPVYSDAQLGAVFFGVAFSDTHDTAFSLAIKNLWETSTGLVLP